MDIVTLAAARKSGGSGGDVTKQYVDDHLALKADKSETAEYPISSATTGINPTITDSADGYVQDLTVYGRTDTVEGELHGIGEDGEVDVVTCGKNLFDINGNHTIDNNDTNHISIVNDSIVFTNNYYIAARYPIYLSPGTYKISCDLSVTTTAYMDISELSLTFHNLTSGHISKTVEISTAGVYTFVFCGEENNSSGEFRNIQLELGTTATAYEPYVSTSATVTTGLPLCGIPVTSGETYTDDRGQKWLADTADVEGVVKRTNKITFDGSEDEEWVRDGSSPVIYDSKRFFISVNQMPKIVETDAKPNGVITGSVLQSQSYTWSTGAGTSFAYNYIQVRIENVVTIEDLKTHLASNPITVVYELATPTTQELTSTEKSALLSLKTFDSTTNVTITDDPTVDVDYLLNTDNGQAVADAIDNAITGVLNTSY